MYRIERNRLKKMDGGFQWQKRTVRPLMNKSLLEKWKIEPTDDETGEFRAIEGTAGEMIKTNERETLLALEKIRENDVSRLERRYAH